MTNPVRELILSAIQSVDHRIAIHEVNVETYETELANENAALTALKAERLALSAALPAETEEEVDDDSEALNA